MLAWHELEPAAGADGVPSPAAVDMLTAADLALLGVGNIASTTMDRAIVATMYNIFILSSPVFRDHKKNSNLTFGFAIRSLLQRADDFHGPCYTNTFLSALLYQQKLNISCGLACAFCLEYASRLCYSGTTLRPICGLLQGFTARIKRWK
jgi:hypothetical protein